MQNKINPQKTKARFGCLLQRLAWKQNGPILKEVVELVRK